MVRANVQHPAQLFLRDSFLFPQITDTTAKFFRIEAIFKQANSRECIFRQFRAHLLTNSFERYQYVLLCNTKTLDFLHFPQTEFFTIQRNKSNAVGIQQTRIECSFISALFHPSRCSTISRLSRPTWQSRNSTLTPAAFASASAVPNSGCVPTFGLTSVMPSI